MTKRADKKRKSKQKVKQSMQQAQKETTKPQVVNTHTHKAKQTKKQNSILTFYDQQYKKLLLIPILMLLFGFLQIGIQFATTGDFLERDISLKGGVSITVPTTEQLNGDDIESFMESRGFSVSVRTLESAGSPVAVIVESDIEAGNDEEIDQFIQTLGEKVTLIEGDYSVEQIGSSISSSFFKQTMIALLFSFIIMSVIVSLTFKAFTPSLAVIAAAFSDIVVTLAIINILGVKVSAAGIAAFLMLIGYSVDTDILLTTRLLKRTEGTLLHRILSAMRTGVLMNGTTLIVLCIGLILSSSDIISQIMLILFVGLLVDQVNTWIQNVGILRLYMEKKGMK